MIQSNSPFPRGSKVPLSPRRGDGRIKSPRMYGFLEGKKGVDSASRRRANRESINIKEREPGGVV